MKPSTVLDALEATWPPAKTSRTGPWTIRDGQGGGKRVSAATADGPVTEGDISQAEDQMRELGQEPLFKVAPEEDELDSILAKMGYETLDPSLLYHCPIETLCDEEPPKISTFPIWPPLQIMRDLWEEGGISGDRLAVMERACEPKTSILGRTNGRAAGAGFVAISNGIAMIHAIEIAPHLRRQGMAGHMIRAAALWALGEGATDFALAVTDANEPAKKLYRSLGMTCLGRYHYRVKP